MDPTAFDLAKILRPVEPAEFFRDHWEQQPLPVLRNDPTYYRGLFSRPDVDTVLAFTRPKFLHPEDFKPHAPPAHNFVQGWLADEESVPVEFYADLADVQRAFGHGKTVIIRAMQHRWGPIASMARRLEEFFGCPVHTNLYLTPPGAQGFSVHYDTHEVFVLQIEGTKHWRFYGSARELPLEEERATLNRDQLGASTQEVFLQPGDMLYMPRGHAHEAFTSDRTSLHLTVGVRVFRWVDLLQQALADLAAQDVRLRHSLPPGLLSRAAAPPSLQSQFQDLLGLFARGARLHDAVDNMTEAFLSKLAVLPHDYFAIADPDTIDLDTMLQRVPGAICRVLPEGEDRVSLHAPGVYVDGPAKVGPALHFIARTPRFAPRALPDNLTADAKLVLVRRLVQEKLLTIVRPAAPASPAEGTPAQ
jgi:hypothetical protein